MLYQLLHEIESARETMTFNQLAAQLQVEESALHGMIDFWVRKGRLRGDEVQSTATAFPVCTTAGCSRCPGAAQCPFVMKMPPTISLNPKITD